MFWLDVPMSHSRSSHIFASTPNVNSSGKHIMASEQQTRWRHFVFSKMKRETKKWWKKSHLLQLHSVKPRWGVTCGVNSPVDASMCNNTDLTHSVPPNKKKPENYMRSVVDGMRQWYRLRTLCDLRLVPNLHSHNINNNNCTLHSIHTVKNK